MVCFHCSSFPTSAAGIRRQQALVSETGWSPQSSIDCTAVWHYCHRAKGGSSVCLITDYVRKVRQSQFIRNAQTNQIFTQHVQDGPAQGVTCQICQLRSGWQSQRLMQVLIVVIPCKLIGNHYNACSDKPCMHLSICLTWGCWQLRRQLSGSWLQHLNTGHFQGTQQCLSPRLPSTAGQTFIMKPPL